MSQMGKGFSLVVSVIVFVMVCTIQCCKHDAKEEPLPFESEIGEEFSGGDLTVNDASVNAFGIKAAGLSNQDYDQFVLGNSFFKTNWIAAPASASARDGLGPLFNTNSCSGCHLLDGRGRPPLYPGEELVNGLLFRLSVSGSDAHGAPLEEPHYGGQFNNAAIANVTSEGNVRVDYTTI
ncbi:MAG: thiol oxidoreductase, partial [Cytophagales bacterium]|nr:thiol oxidoreductase [Cytophaga sp.]